MQRTPDRSLRPAGELVIVIPDGESHFALPVVTCLGRHPGQRVHVVSSDPTARVRWSRYCATFTLARDDDEARIDVVRAVIDRVGAHVVLPVCETGVRLLQEHRIARDGRVALAPCEGRLDIGDKWRLAEILREIGVAHPPTLLYTADAAFRRRLGTFPVLIKPRALSGGYGIREFGDPVSLVSFLEHHPEMALEYVVQESIPGHDIGSSVLCRDGVVLAQSVQKPSHANASRRQTATEVEMFDHPEVAGLVRRLFERLRWSGVANVDVRVDERDGTLSVLDVNPRYWSSMLASHAAGVDFPRLACLAALGVEFYPPRQRTQRFLQAKSSLHAWCSWTSDKPALHETVWPYLLADPVPHLMGRLRRRSPKHSDVDEPSVERRSA